MPSNRKTVQAPSIDLKTNSVHSNGHHESPPVEAESLKAQGVVTPPWAGDEQIDFQSLRAPGFIVSPTKKPANPNKAVSRKLHKQDFIRRYECQESTIPYCVVLDENNRGVTYIIPPDLQDLLSKHTTYANIELVINQDGDLIFVTVPFADRFGNTNDYWTSKRDILAESTTRWVKLLANQSLRQYEPDYPQLPLEDPEWPEIHWGGLFSVAFQGRILHQGHRAMRGLVGGQR
jgi:hypothetical protein